MTYADTNINTINFLLLKIVKGIGETGV